MLLIILEGPQTAKSIQVSGCNTENQYIYALSSLTLELSGYRITIAIIVLKPALVHKTAVNKLASSSYKRSVASWKKEPLTAECLLAQQRSKKLTCIRSNVLYSFIRNTFCSIWVFLDSSPMYWSQLTPLSSQEVDHIMRSNCPSAGLQFNVQNDNLFELTITL